MSRKEDEERITIRVKSRMNNKLDENRKLPWMIKVIGNDTTNRIRLTKNKKRLKKGGFSEKRANNNDI